MVQYTKQDTRIAVALDSYDAAAMLADLGPQRLKDLPLKGRIVYQSDTPSIPKNPGIENEVTAKWSQYMEKEAEELGKKVVDEVEQDGLGLGGSYRKGPNFRPMPIFKPSKMSPRMPGPARFRAGARGPTSGPRRRSPSPPSMRDGFLGPKPTNPSFKPRPFRGQLVTRHVKTKNLAGFGEARSPATSAVSHPVRPEPGAATNLAASKHNTGVLPPSSPLSNLKGGTAAKTAPVAPISSKSQSLRGVSDVTQAANKRAAVTPVVVPSSSHSQKSTTSSTTSRSTSRASSIVPPASTKPTAVPPRQPSRSAAVAIKPPRLRDTIRAPPEASKNHWNRTPLQINGNPSGERKPDAKSSPINFVSIDEAKSPIASTTQKVSSIVEQKPTLEPVARLVESTKMTNWAMLVNQDSSTELVDIASKQKLDAFSHSQTVTKQNSLGMSTSKYADSAPSGLFSSSYADPPSGMSASKYAGPVPTGPSASKYTTPTFSALSTSKHAITAPPGLPASQHAPPGLSDSKYATQAPPGLSSSKYATSGLSASKYAAPAPPGWSASKAAPPAPPGLSSSKYASPQASGLSASIHTTPTASGLSASKYATNEIASTSSSIRSVAESSALSCSKNAKVAPPRIKSSSTLSGPAISQYAPQQLRAAASEDTMKPQNVVSQTEPGEMQVKEQANEQMKEVNTKVVKEIPRESNKSKELKQNGPAIQIEERATVVENDVSKQVPMSAPQRLLDSIAARYKFATPKQISGLARRYGTIVVTSKDSLESVAPQDREIDDGTRAFHALFISRGRRVLVQPCLPVSHDIAS